MTDSPNLQLPEILSRQKRKYKIHNDALYRLDTLVQLAVLDRDLTAPPASPVAGQRWIVAASPTGAWAGHANHVAAWQDGAWQYGIPNLGWTAFVVDEGTLVVWNGTAWGDFFATVTAIQNLARLGVGATADATNPFSAKLNNALWAARTVSEGGDGSLRSKLSKENAAATLSLLFQNNFSGRAEIGLTGDDDFHFKVSPNGTAWYDGLVLTRSNGQARMLSALSVSDESVYAAGVGGQLQLQALNASAGRANFASVSANATTGTAGAEVGDLVLKTMRAGTLTEAWRMLGAGNLMANQNGTAALPVLSWTGDPDTGFYRIGANNIGVSANGAKVLDVGTAGLAVTGTIGATAGSGYYLGSTLFARGTSATYNAVFDPSGVEILSFGNAGDPTNYHKNTTHYFQSRLGVANLAYLNSTGLSIVPTTPSTNTTSGSLINAGGLGNAGAIHSGRSMFPDVVFSTDAAIDCTGVSNVIASGASLNCPDASSGMLIATDGTSGATAAIVMGGGGVAVLGQSTGTSWAATSTPSTSQIGVYFDGVSRYAIKNGFAAAHTCYFTFIRTRPSA